MIDTVQAHTITRRPVVPKEHRLWADVLRTALRDASGVRNVYALNHLKNRLKSHREAKEWVASDSIHVGSYRWICQTLGYDYEYMRECVHNNMSVKSLCVHK